MCSVCLGSIAQCDCPGGDHVWIPSTIEEDTGHDDFVDEKLPETNKKNVSDDSLAFDVDPLCPNCGDLEVCDDCLPF